MKVGIIGGSGKAGSGLALRWAAAGHTVTIGSRDGGRAATRAATLSRLAGATIEGAPNMEVCQDADVVVLTVPYHAHASTLTHLGPELAGKMLIDLTVPLRPPAVHEVHLSPGWAAALEAQTLLGDSVRLVSALHHVSSTHLQDLDHALTCDVLVASDDMGAKEIAISLIADLGVRALDAGPLRNAVALESLTPVLIYLNKRYGGKGAGIRITGIID